MKTLELNQMENIEGGTNRDCLLRGIGVTVGFALSAFGGWAVALVLIATSGDCYTQ